MKLNNYIRAYERKNSSIYNPSPNDLKLWCMSHGPIVRDLSNDEISLNIPLVLDYILVCENLLLYRVFRYHVILTMRDP